MADTPPPTPTDSVARLVRWVIILFFAYAAWHMSMGSSTKSTSTTTSQKIVQSTAPAKDCDNTAASGFPGFNIPMLPAIIPSLHIEDTIVGSGAPAQCGQMAVLRYSYLTKKAEMIFDGKTSETIRIGDNTLLPGLERGLIGMKAGGQRTIGIPPALGFAAVPDMHALSDNAQFKLPADIKDQSVIATAALESLWPQVPISPMPLRVIDTRFGNGRHVECGDEVSFDMTIWKLDGTQLFSTLDKKTPITFTIGESKVPYGIELAATGMTQGSERTVILPPAFVKTLRPCLREGVCEAPLIPLASAGHEIVLVEMTLVPAVEKPAVKMTAPVLPLKSVPPLTPLPKN